MITIKAFSDYWKAMATRVGATRCILVRNETELAQKIKGIAQGELFLVAVIPSADTTARNDDNILEKEMVIIYALKKVSHKEQNDADVLNDMELTQDCITAIKTNLLNDAQDDEADYHHMIKRIDFNRLHTDPEYNYFESDGYSVSLELTTTGF